MIFTNLILTHAFSTSPDGKFLVFLSARSSVDSGAHSATNSLHRIDWPKDVNFHQSAKVHDVVSFFYIQFNSSFMIYLLKSCKMSLVIFIMSVRHMTSA